MVIIIIIFKIILDIVSLRILYQTIMEYLAVGLLSLIFGFIVAAIILGRGRSALRREVEQGQVYIARLEGELNVCSERNKILEDNIKKIEEIQKEEREHLRGDFEEKLQSLTLLFKDKAAEILQQKSEDLARTNQNALKNVVDPLQDKMDQFRKAVEESKEKSLANTTRVEEQIKAMIAHTESIKGQAENLASALRSNNKVQGNWGELILGNILEGMGLKEGQDYELQAHLTDVDGTPLKNEDSNRKMIPDAVVFLPENRAIAVDSKVSLAAYTAYVNAESEQERSDALAAHCRSVEGHIKELSDKEYGKYLNRGKRNSLEYVVMFIPNEGAFQLFYRSFPQKWHQAFDRKIIIAGESNLFAMLKIIETTWIQVKQQKNTEDVMRLATELLDRVTKFVNTFDEVGKDFARVQNRYTEARNTLFAPGHQSILVTAKKMERKGVVPKVKLISANELDDVVVEMTKDN